MDLATTLAAPADGTFSDCPICMEALDTDSIKLHLCTEHFFHRACARQMLDSSGKCGLCGTFYVPKNGTQPDGSMSVREYPPGRMPLSGHEREGTIIISYNFPSGIQGPQHPSPGARFSGTSRTAYLPDNSEGRDVLRLLRLCFDRKHTFTVGTSVTTGQSNCVVWNGVHHKTNTSGGSSYFGYPDPTYFQRVKQELAAKGIN